MNWMTLIMEISTILEISTPAALNRMSFCPASTEMPVATESIPPTIASENMDKIKRIGTKINRLTFVISNMREKAIKVITAPAMFIRELRNMKYMAIRNSVKMTNIEIIPRPDFSLSPEIERK